MIQMQRQLETQARNSAAAVVRAMDFGQLFGDDLMDQTEKIAGWRDPLLDALQNKIVKEIELGNDNTVTMPRTLTAENGAKAALMGEFEEKVNLQCSSCHGSGLDDDEEEACEECEGAGEYSLAVPVTWTTIKEIYKKAVEILGK